MFLPLKSNTDYLFLYFLENDMPKSWWSVCCNFAKLTCDSNMHQNINLVVIACYFKFILQRSSIDFVVTL
jgi:hypothetical protein